MVQEQRRSSPPDAKGIRPAFARQRRERNLLDWTPEGLPLRERGRPLDVEAVTG
jgi:hypothetical protein